MKPWWDADPFSRCIWEPLPFQTHPCLSMLSKWLSLERNSLFKSSCYFFLVNNLFVSCSWQPPSKEKLLLWEFGLLIQYYILLCWIVCESFHCWSSTFTAPPVWRYSSLSSGSWALLCNEHEDSYFGQQQSHFQVTCSYMHVTLELPC